MSVLVSGATGFVAQHIINDLLEQGYNVIGTVRTHEKADKLKEKFGNNSKLSLELVPDIAAPKAFDDVFEKHAANLKIVLHTASPLFFNTEDFEKDLLIPATNGTKSILESIKKYAADTVERVVVTSSFAAVMDLSREGEGSLVYTEEAWNPVSRENYQQDGVGAYFASKKLAEAAAWDFWYKNRDCVKFALSTINPVYVFGPQLFDEDVKESLNTSCELINALVRSKPEAKLSQSEHGYYIDVRDVAKAHLIAFQSEEAVGQRLILANGPFTFQDIEDIVNDSFPQLRGKILVGNPGTGEELYKTFPSVDNSKTKKILNIPFKSLKETIYDTAAQILKKEGNI